MNKLLLIFLAIGAGVIGFNAERLAAEQTRTATAVREQEWKASASRLAEMQATAAALRGEVLDKKQHLRELLRHPGISPELLPLLEGDASKGHTAAWADLRQQLGIGWSSSPDYVLVSKRVLKELSYPQLDSASQATETACGLLALSPGEQSALRSALQHAQERHWLSLERTEPSGDILAQYTVAPPDPVSEQSASNSFAAEVAGVVGPERASLFLPGAWREFKSELAPSEAETMTIRRSAVDGEPDLICEMRQGDRVSTSPVRFARYPSMWFLTLFPGGWKTLAQREGFELPQRFQK